MGKSLNVTASRTNFLRITIMGLLLSVVASVLAICILLLLDLFVIEPFLNPNTLNPWEASWRISEVPFLLMIFTLNVMALACFAIVPIIIGGGIITFVLQWLAYYRSPKLKASLLIGSLVGFCVGWVTAAFVLPTISVSGQWEPRGDPFWTGIVGAGAGLVHSWMLHKLLKKTIPN